MAVRGAGAGSANPLVGRTEEREAIDAAVREAVAGQPSVVWVEGDPGFGKTALVRHALGRMPTGVRVYEAHADELATEVPFELAGRLGASITESSFAAGMQLLEVWARHQDEGPVALVVEDLHWADAASSKALLCAAQRLEEDRVVLIVTTLPGVRDGWERLQTDSGRCRRIVLSALSAEDVAAMAATQGVGLTPNQAERLHRHTAGHPLYVRTLLSELSPAELRAAEGDLPAPTSLTSLVTAGLSEVREPARRLAAAMAVVNQRAGLVEIARVAGVDAPIEPFEDLLGTGFVHWDPDEPGTPVAFVHPLYRQAIYRDLSPRTRRDLHHRAVGISGPAAALAHRVAAADGTDDALADELALSAGSDMARGASGLAARNLLWSSSLSSDPTRAEERLLAAARAYVDSGQTIRATALRTRIEACQTSPLARPSARTDRLGPGPRHRGPGVAGVRRRSGPPDERAGRGGTGVGRAGRDPCDGRAGPRRQSTRPNGRERWPCPTRRRSAWPSCISRWRRRSSTVDRPDSSAYDCDFLVRRRACRRATWTCWWRGRPSPSTAVARRAALADLRAVLALARQGSVLVQIARCHFEMATLLVSTGAWNDALLHARIGLGVASDEGQPSMQSQCHAVLGTLQAYRGEWARRSRRSRRQPRRRASGATSKRPQPPWSRPPPWLRRARNRPG